MEEFLI